jgi:TatD DNase family protein
MKGLPEIPVGLTTPVVDTHCHLDIHDSERAGLHMSVDEALAAAAGVGVTRVVQVGCDVESARWSVELANSRDDVVAAVALHPNDAARLVERGGRPALEAAYDEIASLARHPKVRAIGETGLDYFRTKGDGQEIQRESFRWHIDLAIELDKTLVIHDRDSHDDVLETLEKHGAPSRVVFHCFSGDAAMARHCAERGWFMSFAGVVTFASNDALREALVEVPDDLVLVETDAPYLTPVPHRGATNASYLVPLTVRSMAETRGVDVDELSAALWRNAESAFGAL